MKFNMMIAAAAVAAGAFSTAEAHEGPKLLTTGSGERAAKTAGVSYEDVKGVHLFKGTPRLAGDKDAPTAAMSSNKVNITIVRRAPWRSFRSLRTQGFYSGTGPASRAYTQGFYSGN